MRSPTPRETVLMSAVALIAIVMIQNIWVTPLRPEAQFFGDVAIAAERLPECHCGSDTLYPPSDRHTYQYEDFSDSTMLPTGFETDAFHLYDWRHCRAYVDWWNVDEGLIRAALELDDEMLRRAGDHMRLSVQNVTLGGVHRQMVLGSVDEREIESSFFDQIGEALSAGEPPIDVLTEILPDHECYLVVGVDTATGQVVLDFPDTHGNTGLWGAYPILAVDFHRTGYVFQFGPDADEYLATLWPQINRASVQARAASAARLSQAIPSLDGDLLTPLTIEEREAINRAALAAAPLQLRSGDFDPTALRDHAEALRDMLGPRWPEVQERFAATAPTLTVLGERLDTGELVICHVADPAREGIWGVRPIAVIEPGE